MNGHSVVCLGNSCTKPLRHDCQACNKTIQLLKGLPEMLVRFAVGQGEHGACGQGVDRALGVWVFMELFEPLR